MYKKQMALRMISFAIILGIVISLTGQFYQPAWRDWNNYDTLHGFYKEPKNTVETIFLGASITANGFIPAELYRDYGICAYNLGTEQQPMLGSYYWTKEAYRLHGKTLKTVILDTSMLRRSPIEAFYRKAIDAMHLSENKIEAVRDYTESLNDEISYLFPMFSYHSRWSGANYSDFRKVKYIVKSGTRGYNFAATRYIDYSSAVTDLAVPSYLINYNATETVLDEDSLYYLKKLINFTKEHDLKLILTKTPVISSWSSNDHNAVAKIADRYNLNFIDFNFEPYLSESGYNHAIDSADGGHMNYQGASKITKWFGRYLSQNCGATDVRNDFRYAFMNESLKNYEDTVGFAMSLKNEDDIAGYIDKAVRNPDCELFIAVKDDASGALTDRQRSVFREAGLISLAAIQFRSSYLAVINNGKVSEKDEPDRGEVIAENDWQQNDIENAELNKENIINQADAKTISEKGVINGDIPFVLTSGGLSNGNVASCTINGAEYMYNSRGINIVVYNKKYEEIVDQAVFDTCGASKRTSWDLSAQLYEYEREHPGQPLPGDLIKLANYNELCRNTRKAMEDKVNELH